MQTDQNMNSSGRFTAYFLSVQISALLIKHHCILFQKTSSAVRSLFQESLSSGLQGFMSKL